MDGESYKCHFEKSICQNIPKNSVIVIDNTPYHSKNTENYPTSKWRKQQFVDWLTEKNITFPDKALRAELWTLVKSEREKFPDKVMETVAKEYGHEILRLSGEKKRRKSDSESIEKKEDTADAGENDSEIAF